MISLGLGAPSTLPAAPSGESAITVGSVAGAAVAPGSSLGVLALESVENIHFFSYMYHNKTDCIKMTLFRLLITVCQLPYFNTDCQMFYFNDACQMYC